MDKLMTNICKKETCAEVREFSSEQPLDCSLALPEYFGDIVKILRCSVNPAATSVTCGSGRISAEGTNTFRIIYAAEDGGIYSYETAEQFAKYIDAGSFDSDCNIVDFIWAEGVVCRAVSSRRIEIRGNIRFRFKVYGKTSVSLLDSAEGCGIQLKTVKFTSDDAVNTVSKKISVNDTYEIPTGKPAVSRIINASADAVVTETKSISNKIMIKGELCPKTLYVPDGGNSASESIKFSLPFSEIVDVPGITDDMYCRVKLKVLNCDVSMKPMQNGSMRILECGAVLQAIVSCGRQTEHTAVTDVFSVDYEIETKKSTVGALEFSQRIAESFVSSGEFELADLAPEKITDHECRIESVKTARSDGKVTVSGAAVFGMMIETAAGTVSYVERNLDFSFSKDIDCVGDCVFDPVLSVSASSAVLNGHKAEVKAEIFAEGNLDICRQLTAVSEVNICEDKPKKKDGSEMIIYFADKDEKIWDIAKKYGTSPELLSKDNNIDGETVPDKRTLLISCI